MLLLLVIASLWISTTIILYRGEETPIHLINICENNLFLYEQFPMCHCLTMKRYLHQYLLCDGARGRRFTKHQTPGRAGPLTSELTLASEPFQVFRFSPWSLSLNGSSPSLGSRQASVLPVLVLPTSFRTLESCCHSWRPVSSIQLS